MGWTILSIIIFVLGLIGLFIFTTNKQKEVGFAATFITTGLSLIVGSFGTLIDKIVAVATNDTITNNYAQLISGFILIILGLWMLSYVSNKLSILNLLGVKERRIEEHRKDVGLNQFEFKEREIDLSFFTQKEMSIEYFNDATELIKLKVATFTAENKKVKIGYTGTASIPLIMYAGFCYRGKPTSEFFEYNRFESKYTKLKQIKKWYRFKKKYPEMVLEEPLNNLDLTGSEVVLGVSTTGKIQSHHILQFNSPFVHLTIDNPKQNSIEFEEQLQDYVKKIFELLIELSNKPSVQRIHLVMSTQSCIAFELGKQLTTDTYMKEVINYHFINNTDLHYPWGISFSNFGIRLEKY